MKRFLKIIGWSFLVVILLAAGVAMGVYCYFTPARIISLVEKEVSENLDTDLKIANFNYKIWKTYPWLYFEADSIQISTKSLHMASPEDRRFLPSNSDLLASIIRIKGEINIKDLLKKDVVIRGLFIEKPSVNIVVVNDSINNFTFPIQNKKIKIKELDPGEIKIEAPMEFSFISLLSDVEIKSSISEFYITKKDNNIYGIGFKGDLSGKYKEIQTPGEIPLELDITTSLAFPLVTMEMNDMSLKIADIKMEASGKAKADMKNLTVENLNIGMVIPDVFALIKDLPPQLTGDINMPQGLSGYLPLNIHIKLLSDYSIKYKDLKNIGLRQLPSLKATVSIDDASLGFDSPNAKPLKLNDVVLLADAIFNPDDSMKIDLDISKLKMHGEGIDLDARIAIKNILGAQQPFDAKLKYESNLLKTLSYLMPTLGVRLDGHLKGETELGGYALNLGKDGVRDLIIKGDVFSNSLKISQGDKIPEVYAGNLKSKYDIAFPGYPGKSYKGTDIDLSFTGGYIKSIQGKKELYSLSGINIDLNVDDNNAGSLNPEGDILVRLDTIRFKQGDIKFNGLGMNFSAKGHLLNSPQKIGTQFYLPETDDEKLIISKIPHTPLYLEYSGEDFLQTLVNLMKVNSEFTFREGSLEMPAYLFPFDFKGLSLTTDFDKLDFSAKKVRLGDSGFSISGEISGVKDFVSANYPTLLKAQAEISFDNVDINQLSWGYYGALLKQGRDSVYYLAPMLPLTSADSMCVAIPRNIEADISLKSKEAEYMQFKFAPLQTQIILKDGNATLKNLSIGTPYCDVIVDWTYATRNLDDIFMQVDARINKFDFSSFYNIFPSLVDNMPELKNFTGDIYSNVGAKFLMYPTMFLDAPSLTAKFNLKGTNLQFARHGKIERITHLMLIEGDEPIKLDNLNIIGGFHDNLLQINPFTIEFDDYCIGVAGINNMQGKMYYQLSLEKSPFHLPFGVRLEGDMKHPEVRLGGTHINEKMSEIVAEGSEWNPSINIMAYLKHGFKIFLQEAAKYQEKNKNGK